MARRRRRRMSGKKGIEAQDRRQGKRTVRSSVQVERTYPSPSYFILSVICANVAQNYLVHERLIYLPTMYSVHMTLHRFHIIISSHFPCFLFGCSVSAESRGLSRPCWFVSYIIWTRREYATGYMMEININLLPYTIHTKQL